MHFIAGCHEQSQYERNAQRTIVVLYLTIHAAPTAIWLPHPVERHRQAVYMTRKEFVEPSKLFYGNAGLFRDYLKWNGIGVLPVEKPALL